MRALILTAATAAAYAVTQHPLLFVLLAMLGAWHLVTLARSLDRDRVEPTGIEVDRLFTPDPRRRNHPTTRKDHP